MCVLVGLPNRSLAFLLELSPDRPLTCVLARTPEVLPDRSRAFSLARSLNRSVTWLAELLEEAASSWTPIRSERGGRLDARTDLSCERRTRARTRVRAGSELPEPFSAAGRSSGGVLPSLPHLRKVGHTPALVSCREALGQGGGDRLARESPGKDICIVYISNLPCPPESASRTVSRLFWTPVICRVGNSGSHAFLPNLKSPTSSSSGRNMRRSPPM